MGNKNKIPLKFFSLVILLQLIFTNFIVFFFLFISDFFTAKGVLKGIINFVIFFIFPVIMLLTFKFLYEKLISKHHSQNFKSDNAVLSLYAIPLTLLIILIILVMTFDVDSYIYYENKKALLDVNIEEVNITKEDNVGFIEFNNATLNKSLFGTYDDTFYARGETGSGSREIVKTYSVIPIVEEYWYDSFPIKFFLIEEVSNDAYELKTFMNEENIDMYIEVPPILSGQKNPDKIKGLVSLLDNDKGYSQAIESVIQEYSIQLEEEVYLLKYSDKAYEEIMFKWRIKFLIFMIIVNIFWTAVPIYRWKKNAEFNKESFL